MSDHRVKESRFVLLGLTGTVLSYFFLHLKYNLKKLDEKIAVLDNFSEKDTVTADEEDDEVNAHHHVGEDGPPVGHDAVVHDGVPVFSREDLKPQSGRKR